VRLFLFLDNIHLYGALVVSVWKTIATDAQIKFMVRNLSLQHAKTLSLTWTRSWVYLHTYSHPQPNAGYGLLFHEVSRLLTTHCSQ